MRKVRDQNHNQGSQPNDYPPNLVWGIDRRKFYRIALICFLAAILVGGAVGTAISISFH